MDNRSEVREFLTTRRARLTPDQVGLPPTGTRRVPGLRRSEVAAVAGLSVEYYARLERGQIAGASSGVLDALARAQELDEAERAHLFDLARAADGIPTSGRPRRRTPGKARGGPVETIRPGDRVLFEADEEHWHGAAPHRLMVHLAINEGDAEHDVVHWLSPVTDGEQAAAPARD